MSVDDPIFGLSAILSPVTFVVIFAPPTRLTFIIGLI